MRIDVTFAESKSALDVIFAESKCAINAAFGEIQELVINKGIIAVSIREVYNG